MGFFDFLKKKTAPAAPAYGVLCELSVPYLYGIEEKNKDGSDRQALINAAAQGDDLYIKSAPTAEYPISFGVFNKKGKQLGVLPPKFLKLLMVDYAGRNLSAQVVRVKPGRAVNIEIRVTVYDNPPTAKGYTAEEWERYTAENKAVYVVKNGRVYHSEKYCVYDKEYTITTLKKAQAAGLTPCKKCNK